MFLNMEDDKTMFPLPKEENRKTDLAFWVDIWEHPLAGNNNKEE
jgi:hypothetical protein